MAEACLSAGANVTISSSSPSRISDAIKTLETNYSEIASTKKIRGFPCDLSKASLEQDLEKLFEQVGNVDHIVFTAGDKLAASALDDVTLESIIKAGQIRFFAPLLVAKVGRNYLPKSADASLTLTSGSVAIHPIPNWSVVAGYASGLEGMTRNLALDMAPIRVNLIEPGMVDTDLWADMEPAERKKLFEDRARANLTGRVARPEDVAEAYLWCLKDSNATGSVLHTNSGSTLR